MELSREIMTAQRDIEDIKARIKSRQDSFEGSEMLRTQASESKSHTEQSLVDFFGLRIFICKIILHSNGGMHSSF